MIKFLCKNKIARLILNLIDFRFWKCKYCGYRRQGLCYDYDCKKHNPFYKLFG